MKLKNNQTMKIINCDKTMIKKSKFMIQNKNLKFRDRKQRMERWFCVI